MICACLRIFFIKFCLFRIWSGIVTVPLLKGCLYCLWVPFWRVNFQPSDITNLASWVVDLKFILLSSIHINSGKCLSWFKLSDCFVREQGLPIFYFLNFSASVNLLMRLHRWLFCERVGWASPFFRFCFFRICKVIDEITSMTFCEKIWVDADLRGRFWRYADLRWFWRVFRPFGVVGIPRIFLYYFR